MLRFAKVALILALPACASAQGSEPLGTAAAGHPMMHRSPDHTRIVVSATGSASRTPDQALVNLAIETAGRSAQQAAAENARTMDRIIAALRELDIPEDRIRTTSYSMYPEYRHFDGRDPEQASRQPEIIGYRVMNMVTVTVDGAERAGAVIDAALEAGANRIDGLSFQLSDVEGARAEALRDAVAKARAEAELLARAAGLELGAPIEISTSYFAPPPMPPMPMYMARDMAQAAVPTPVQPGMVEMQAVVNIVYSAD